MLMRNKGRSLLRGLGCLFVLAGITFPAAAHAASAATPASAARSSAQSTASLIPAGTPRFFSINRVLAKADGTPAQSVALPGMMASADPIADLIQLSFTVPAFPFARRGFVLFGAAQRDVESKWQDINTQWAAQEIAIAHCEQQDTTCTPAMRSFIAVRDEARAADASERLDIINMRVNALVRYTSDLEQHGTADLWQTPLATLGGRGDCEDYAIAKYMIAQAAGISADDMRLLLVRDTRLGEDHAVLAVREQGEWQMLDNRWNTLHADAQLGHYRPAYAISQGGVDLFAAPYALHDDASLPFLPSTAGVNVQE